MSVAKRMYLLICSAIVGLVLVAGIGLQQMGSIFTAANFANENVVPSLVILNNTLRSVSQLRITVYRLILNKDASKVPELEGRLETIKNNIRDTIKAYEPLLADERDRQLLNQTKTLFADYVTALSPVLEQARQLRQEKAMEVVGNAASLAEKLNNAVEEHVNYNVELGSKAAQSAVSTKGDAMGFAIGLSLLTAIAVLAIGLLILRNLLKQLGGEPADAAAIADNIAKGDLSVSIRLNNNDTTSLMSSMDKMVQAVRLLNTDALMLADAAVAGKLSTRADASKHQGDFRKIVEGVNHTLDAVIGPLNVAANYVDGISRGAIPAKITDSYNGDFNTIKNNLNTCIDAVNSLVSDANLLSEAAVAGKLATRADASKHQGDFRKIVEGVNQTLDAVIGPLNVAANYVDRISKGDIPTKITDSYNGDFNTIKNNLNTCIDAVNALVADANRLSVAAVEGKLETRADAMKHQGDFRKIVEGVNATLDAIVGPINEVVRILGALEQGDLTQAIAGSYNGTFRSLQDAANNTVMKLSSTISEVRLTANSVTNSAEQVSATAQSLSQSSSEQAASVEETSASVEEMTASINQNTENARVTDNMASKAAQEANEGGEAVRDTVQAMKQIAAKIGIIDDIAYQTNLLALNAAIEAARAGEHGKGFAVVAAEVRKLAERSQVAAQEIGELAGSSVNLAEHAGQLLNEMVPSIRKTSDLVQEIAAASQEQSQGVGQINSAMSQLNMATQQNASASEELAATAEEMGAQADQLQNLMAFFRVNQGQELLFASSPSVRSAKPMAVARGGSGFASLPASEQNFERF